jgi:hypothetical protein
LFLLSKADQTKGECFMLLQKRNDVYKMQAMPTKLAQLASCLGLFMFLASVQSGPALAAGPVLSELVLNRPSSSPVGSVRVWTAKCGSNDKCVFANTDGTAVGRCITLSLQNQDYKPGTVNPASGITLKRYAGGHCDGDVNPQNQTVNVNPNGPTRVDVVAW